MALDRFVNFPEGKFGPTRKEIELVVRNFFGEAATSIEWSNERLYIELPGHLTFPFAGIADGHAAQSVAEDDRGRWIEVYPGPTLDVITRRQDEFTNALAQRLAEIFARYWEGEVDDGT